MNKSKNKSNDKDTKSEKRKKKEPEKVHAAKDSSSESNDSDSSTDETAYTLFDHSTAYMEPAGDSDYSMLAKVDTPMKIPAEECAAASLTANTVPYHIDSAATSSCSPFRGDFSELTPIETRSIKGVNGSTIAAIGIGTIRIQVGNGQHITLRDVLYAPQAALHLISVGRLTDDNMTILFEKGKCTVRSRDNKTLVEATRKDRGLYTLLGNHFYSNTASLARALPTITTWHRRLGHVSHQAIIDMAKLGMAKGMPVDTSITPATCEHCILGKQAKTPVPRI